MAATIKNGKTNHYSDWLFYLLIAIALIGGYFAFQYHNSSTSFKEALKNTSDTLATERSNLLRLSNTFNKQSQLIIINSGTTAFTLDKFIVFYYDNTEKKFKLCEGGLDGEIQPGGECRPKVVEGSNKIWNGEVIAYHIEVVSIKNYYKNVRFCQNGSMEDGNTITINADFSEKNPADDHRATCNSK